MSAISTSTTAIAAYAMKRSNELQATIKVYYRISTDEFIATAPGSDAPTNSRYIGAWVWTEQGSQWKQYVKHESKRVE